MEACTNKNRFMTRVAFRSLLVMALTLSATGCSTLPKPTDGSSSLIILSVEAKRAIAPVRPSIVTIVRKEDGVEIPFTDKNGKYYYFANLPTGTYQVKSAAMPVNSGNSSLSAGATITFTNANSFPFDQGIVEASTVNLKAGTVAFMGSFTAEGTGKLFPPGAIEISNVKISTNGEDRQAAQDAFRQAYKDSAWTSRF